MSRFFARTEGARTKGANTEAALLLSPAGLSLLLLLFVPVVLLLRQSLLPVTDGVAAEGGWTLANYAAFGDQAYGFYFYDTIRLAALAAALGLLLGAPLAFTCARTRSRVLRRAILLLLVGMLFMSGVARLYAIQASFARTGPLAWVAPLLGIRPGSPGFATLMVVTGLLHFVLPSVGLMLVGTFQNLNPRLEEAAATLGASRLRVVLDIIVPAARPGLGAAFMLAFAMGISNFVVPLVLGRGVVVFVTNLIYVRVSQIADFPSAAALAVMMLLVVSALVYLLSRLVARAGGRAA